MTESLSATQAQSAAPAPGAGARASAAAEDRELKFSLTAGRVDFARRWLEAMCRPDPEYPTAWVWTIYYDTPLLESLAEKVDSEYLKLKVRLRWYSPVGGRPAGPAFVEAKMREGTLRTKVRVPAPWPAAALAEWDLQDSRLRPLPLLLREHGVPVGGDWQPVLQLRYRRDRFIDPAGGARVSLDSDIAAVRVNHRFLSALDGSPIGSGVLEVKGDVEALPRSLQALVRFGARQRSFSKFLAIYRHVTRTIN